MKKMLLLVLASIVSGAGNFSTQRENGDFKVAIR